MKRWAAVIQATQGGIMYQGDGKSVGFGTTALDSNSGTETSLLGDTRQASVSLRPSVPPPPGMKTMIRAPALWEAGKDSASRVRVLLKG